MVLDRVDMILAYREFPPSSHGLGYLPVGSYAITLQFFAGLTGPVPFVASPALIFAY